MCSYIYDAMMLISAGAIICYLLKVIAFFEKWCPCPSLQQKTVTETLQHRLLYILTTCCLVKCIIYNKVNLFYISNFWRQQIHI